MVGEALDGIKLMVCEEGGGEGPRDTGCVDVALENSGVMTVEDTVLQLTILANFAALVFEDGVLSGLSSSEVFVAHEKFVTVIVGYRLWSAMKW